MTDSMLLDSKADKFLNELFCLFMDSSAVFNWILCFRVCLFPINWVCPVVYWETISPRTTRIRSTEMQCLPFLDTLMKVSIYMMSPKVERCKYSALISWPSHCRHTADCAVISSAGGVPNLCDLMRWSWCNNNRNKQHNEYSALEASWNHALSPRFVGKLSSTKPVLGLKEVEDHCFRASPRGYFV